MGAWVGFIGWQIYFAPFVYSADSSRLAHELKITRMILEVFDKGEMLCGKSLLAANIISSLDVSVPASLKERMDQRFHDMLREEAEQSRAYLNAHPELLTGNPCYKGQQSNPPVDPDAHESSARGSP